MSSDHTGSRVAAVTACYIVPIPLEILATGLRIYARQRQSRARLDRFAIDDFFILFATVGGRPIVEHLCALPRSDFTMDQKSDFASLDLRGRPMLCGPGIWFDMLPRPPDLTSDSPRAGPPHGFGKHIDQVSAQDFETFEVVPRYIAPAEQSCCTKLTLTHISRATIYSAISTM